MKCKILCSIFLVSLTMFFGCDVDVDARSDNANLSSLSITGAQLSPGFSADTTVYTTNVPTSVSQTTVTATLEDTKATVKINGEPSPATIDLTNGENSITIEVTAEDDSTIKTYTVNVTREQPSSTADLSALTLSGTGVESLTPSFSSSTIAYDISIAYTCTSATLAATAIHPGADITSITLDGSAASLGVLTLYDATHEIIVTVTAEDGTTTKAYTLTVNREAPSTNADLSSLSLSGPGVGALDPIFSSSTTSYDVEIISICTAGTLTALADHSGATITSITLDGPAASLGTLTLDDAIHEITVTVTAEDGSTIKTYTINVTRLANSGTGTQLIMSSWQAGDLNGGSEEWFYFDAVPGQTYKIYNHDEYFTHPENPGSPTFDCEIGVYQLDMVTSYSYAFPNFPNSEQVDIYQDNDHIEFTANEAVVQVKATPYSGSTGLGSYWVKVEEVLPSFSIVMDINGNGYVERRVNGVLSSGPFPFGTTVELTAVARDSDSFSGWSGDLSGIQNPIDVVTSANMAVTANFTGINYQPSIIELEYGPSDIDRTVNLTDLSGKSVYLVKANYADNSISEDTGVAQLISKKPDTAVFGRSNNRVDNLIRRHNISKTELEQNELRYVDDDIYVLDKKKASEFNNSRHSLAHTAKRKNSFSLPNMAYLLGDDKYFWVDDGPADDGSWELLRAHVRAVGQHCYIWVFDSCYNNTSVSSTDNLVTTTQAENLRDSFDTMYPYITNVFGYENGGGASGDGGVDSDKKISIFIYDIENDYEPSQTGGVLGYFWSKDNYPDDELFSTFNIHSNEAEMFYVDTHFADAYESHLISALGHEFQHMIHFNQKTLIQNEETETWYNEMLSMVCEDMLYDLLGTTLYDSHPTGRVDSYNGYYTDSGITDWLGDVRSYSSAYIFGGFLLRSFGIEYVHQLSTNASVGIEAIDEACSDLGVSETFDSLMAEYTKLLVFPTGHADISMDFTGQSESYNGYIYEYPSFDLFYSGLSNVGPYVLDIASDTLTTLRKRGFQVWSQNSWLNLANDTLSVTVDKPANDSVKLYLMIK